MPPTRLWGGFCLISRFCVGSALGAENRGKGKNAKREGKSLTRELLATQATEHDAIYDLQLRVKVC